MFRTVSQRLPCKLSEKAREKVTAADRNAWVKEPERDRGPRTKGNPLTFEGTRVTGKEIQRCGDAAWTLPRNMARRTGPTAGQFPS